MSNMRVVYRYQYRCISTLDDQILALRNLIFSMSGAGAAIIGDERTQCDASAHSMQRLIYVIKADGLHRRIVPALLFSAPKPVFLLYLLIFMTHLIKVFKIDQKPVAFANKECHLFKTKIHKVQVIFMSLACF